MTYIIIYIYIQISITFPEYNFNIYTKSNVCTFFIQKYSSISITSYFPSFSYFKILSENRSIITPMEMPFYQSRFTIKTALIQSSITSTPKLSFHFEFGDRHTINGMWICIMQILTTFIDASPCIEKHTIRKTTTYG